MTFSPPPAFTAPEPDPDLIPEPAWGLVPEPRGTDETGTTEPAGGSGPAVPGTTTELVPVFTVPARRISLTKRLMLAARSRIALIAADQKRHRTFWYAIGVFITRLPETQAETERHLESRQWLQEWMTGRLRVFCEWENIAWGHLVSIPGRSVLQLIEKVFFERQSRCWIAVALIAVVVIICTAGHP